jgi:hypothetical protein
VFYLHFGIVFGIVKPNPPSALPGIVGNIGSSGIQEQTGNTTWPCKGIT